MSIDSPLYNNIMIKPLINDQTFLDLVIRIKNPDLLKSVISRMGEQFWQHPLVVEENGASCFRRIASLGLINMSKIWGDALNWEREDYQIELREALKENNLEIVQVCILLGANVNKVSPEGEPPVFQAILSGNINLLETLLQNGAFISRIDYKGEISLHKAVRSGNLEMVERILITKPELELKNAEGLTALELALENKAYEIVECLVSAGVEVDGIKEAGEEAYMPHKAVDYRARLLQEKADNHITQGLYKLSSI